MTQRRAFSLRLLIALALLLFVHARVVDCPLLSATGPGAGEHLRLIAVSMAALPVALQIEAKPQFLVKSDDSIAAGGKGGSHLATVLQTAIPLSSGSGLAVCQRPLWLLNRALLI